MVENKTLDVKYCKVYGKETNHYKNGSCVVFIAAHASKSNKIVEKVCEICGKICNVDFNNRGINFSKDRFADGELHFVCDKCKTKKVICNK